MADRTFTWRKSVPQELAQFALPELPEELRWPPYVSRLDLLASEGRTSVVRQLYQQLLGLKLTYEGAGFEPLATDLQQIRRPREILERRVGTCIDLTLLLAGMCLAADLLPLVVVLDGHALLAVALTTGRTDATRLPQQGAFRDGLLRDLEQLRAWTDDERYLLVECTGVAASQGGLSPELPEGIGRSKAGTMSFDRACAAGLEQIGAPHAAAEGAPVGRGQRQFLYAVHIHDCQLHGFAPLAETPVPPSSGTTINQTGQTNIGSVGSIGTFVAGDDVAGDKVSGDKVMGNKVERRGGLEFGSGNQFGDITIGDVAGGNIFKGNVFAGDPGGGRGTASRFAAIYAQIGASGMSEALKPMITNQVRQIEAEAAKGALGDRQLVQALLGSLVALAPEVRAEVARALAGSGLDR